MRKTLLVAASVLMLAASCGTDSSRGTPGISGSGEPSSGEVLDSTDASGTGSTDTSASGSGSGSGSTVVELDPDDVVLTAGLVRFNDCDALLDYFHEEYSARVGPWGFDRGGWFGPMPVFAGGDGRVSHGRRQRRRP